MNNISLKQTRDNGHNLKTNKKLGFFLKHLKIVVNTNKDRFRNVYVAFIFR